MGLVNAFAPSRFVELLKLKPSEQQDAQEYVQLLLAEKARVTGMHRS